MEGANRVSKRTKYDSGEERPPKATLPEMLRSHAQQEANPAYERECPEHEQLGNFCFLTFAETF